MLFDVFSKLERVVWVCGFVDRTISYRTYCLEDFTLQMMVVNVDWGIELNVNRNVFLIFPVCGSMVFCGKSGGGYNEERFKVSQEIVEPCLGNSKEVVARCISRYLYR